jgi:hypothetical protein
MHLYSGLMYQSCYVSTLSCGAYRTRYCSSSRCTRYDIECGVYCTTVSQEYHSRCKHDGSLSICLLCPHSVTITMSFVPPHVFPVYRWPLTHHNGPFTPYRILTFSFKLTQLHLNWLTEGIPARLVNLFSLHPKQWPIISPACHYRWPLGSRCTQ